MGCSDYPTTFEIERVSISEAVRISGLKMRTLQNLAAQGAITGAAKPAGRWTFDIAQLRCWARETPGKAMPCPKTSSFATGSIDLTRGVATIHKTKGSKLRAVPLSDEAVAILKRQPKSHLSQIVFHRTDGQTMDWVSSQFGATARRLEQRSAQKPAQCRHAFVRFRFHDLRHLFAVRFLQKSGSIYTLQGILGHTSVKTTEIYLAYLTPDQQQKSKIG